MKKLLAILLTLCLLLPACALAETETAVTETETAETETAAAETAETEAEQQITLHDIRYYFEHRLNRDYFFSGAGDWIDTLKEAGPFDFWSWLTDQIGFDVTFSEADFGFRELERDGIRMAVLEMPKAEQVPDCCRIWMCVEPATGKAWYYTVEYDNFMGEAWYLCEWVKTGDGDNDWNHMDYGPFAAADSSAEDYEAQLEAEAGLIADSIRGTAR